MAILTSVSTTYSFLGLHIDHGLVNQPFIIYKKRAVLTSEGEQSALLSSTKNLTQAADTLSLILQNISELSYLWYLKTCDYSINLRGGQNFGCLLQKVHVNRLKSIAQNSFVSMEIRFWNKQQQRRILSSFSSCMTAGALSFQSQIGKIVTMNPIKMATLSLLSGALFTPILS